MLIIMCHIELIETSCFGVSNAPRRKQLVSLKRCAAVASLRCLILFTLSWVSNHKSDVQSQSTMKNRSMFQIGIFHTSKCRNRRVKRLMRDDTFDQTAGDLPSSNNSNGPTTLPPDQIPATPYHFPCICSTHRISHHSVNHLPVPGD